MIKSDPPCYTRNKIMEARARVIQENNIKFLESGVLDELPYGNLARGKKAQKYRPNGT